MKKILALGIMLMFIISLAPLALAEKHDDKRVNGKERVIKTLEDLKEPKVRGLDKKQGFAKRIKKARENRVKAKKYYEESLKKFKKQREEQKKDAKSARCKEDSQECREKKAKNKRGVLKRLENTINVIDKSLEKLLNRVEESEALLDEEKDSSAARIAELEKKLEGERTKVLAMSEESTAPQIRDAIKNLKNIWQDTRKEQRSIVAHLTNNKLDKLVEKHDEFTNGMQSRVDELKAQGVDTVELQTLLGQFKEESSDLKGNQNRARQKWNDARESGASLDEWKASQKVVRDDLVSTKKTLREFMSNYRDLKKGIKELDFDNESESSDKSTTIGE